MPFNVTEFRAKVRDFARQYLFEMEMAFPSTITATDLPTYLVEAASVPGRVIEPIDIPFMGQQYKIAGQVTYDDWVVTFRIDDNYDIYKLFRAWSELIKGTESNIASFPAQYKADPVVYQLDAAQTRLNQISLKGAWPNSIGEIALATGENAYQTFDVSFSYDFSKYEVL